MGRRLLKLVVLVGVAAFGMPQQAFASDFGPFQGKVVDAATKEPIEGAVVFVDWFQIHFFAGSTFYDAQETVTDKNGEFVIPGIWVLNPWRYFSVDAGMIVYKSGYRAIQTGAFRNWGQINQELDYVLKVEEGEPTLMLRRLTLEERKRADYPGTSRIPGEKKKLLMEEINRERRFLGLGKVTS
jgi:hypothetical protein